MTPERFPEANTTLGPPPGWTDEQCTTIHAFIDGAHVVTVWKPTPQELVRLNLGEPIYLTIFSRTMAPVTLGLATPFLEPPEDCNKP